MTINDQDGFGQDRMILAEGRIHRLENKLGHNGPYGGRDGDVYEFDCRYMQGHSALFRRPECFEDDLVKAINDIQAFAENINEGIVMGAKKRVTAVLAITALNACSRYLQEAQIMAEVLSIKAPERKPFRFTAEVEASVEDGNAWLVEGICVDELLAMDHSALERVYTSSQGARDIAARNIERIEKIRELKNS